MATAAFSKVFRVLASIVFASVLAGCGGGGGGSSGPYTISGSITGLVGTVVLQNGTDRVSRSANGTFTFPASVASGRLYNVLVHTQPDTQNCVVTNPAGMANANVTNVVVACTLRTYTLGGHVHGLNGTLVLAEQNRKLSTIVTPSDSLEFGGMLSHGDAYAVAVYKQPLGQTCIVASGATGTATAPVGNVIINCQDNANTVSGSVSGLTSGTVTLQLNFADNLVVGNGAFAFPKRLANGAPYVVSIASVAGHTCGATGAAGTANANVTDVVFTCAPLPATLPVGGNVQGLSGTVVLRNSVNNETVSVAANGNFTFPTAVAVGTEYAVLVQTQPASQTCSVGSANIFVNPLAVNATGVRCAAGTEIHTVTGTVNGLKAPLKLAVNLNNAVLDVAPPSGSLAATFTFPVAFQYGTEFMVSVRQQPTGQTCVIPNAGSHVQHFDVTDILVSCVDNVTDPLSGTYMAPGGDFALTFYPDGVYAAASVKDDPACGASQGSGVEMGAYRFNLAAGTLQLVSNALDTNGTAPGCGVWQGNGIVIHPQVFKTGAGQDTVLFTRTTGGPVPVALVPVSSVGNRLVGSYAAAGGLSFVVFMGNRYLEANVNNDPASNAPAGVEYGCYSITGVNTGSFTPTVDTTTCPGAADTDAAAGFSGSAGTAVGFNTGPGFLILDGGEVVGSRILPF